MEETSFAALFQVVSIVTAVLFRVFCILTLF
jgi:hypothetical protein